MFAYLCEQKYAQQFHFTALLAVRSLLQLKHFDLCFFRWWLIATECVLIMYYLVIIYFYFFNSLNLTESRKVPHQ